jgi:hypothetical protein
MSVRERLRSDHGASMFLVAMSLLLLLGASAIAVDLAAMRFDRSTDQKVTDSAASAGALAVLKGTGQDACVAGLEYVRINTEELDSVDLSQCATEFSLTCTPGEELTVFEGRYEIRVVYPVSDADPLMTSAQLGAPAQPVVTDDGAPCDRVGVQVSAEHESFFAQLIGFDRGTTTVHSVARSFLPPPQGPPINLLLLDRFGCGVMMASGGGTQGGIIIDKIPDPDNPGKFFPGEGAVDSDASIAGGCPSDEGTIDVNGANAVMRADGPPGCGPPSEDPPDSGQGCGYIKTLAPGTPGCNWPACTGSGSNVPRPEPTALPARLTRAPIDHRYNCRTDGYATANPAWSWAADPLTTSNEQDIPPCEGPHDPRIHTLIAEVGQTGLPSGVSSFPGSWQTWSSLHPDCSVDPGQGFTINGNVWVDCSLLEIKDEVIINGSMVMGNPTGDLAVTSSTGHLNFSNGGSPGFLFMRGGLFSKDGQASITFTETMVYLSKSSRIFMDGGSGGDLIWIAPDDDDHPFDDLALWSDSTIPPPDNHFWAGQALLEMEGVFFTPIVTVEYAGKGEQKQTRAQFIADKLHARGNGVLVVAPVAGRAVDLTSVPQTMLIR